MSGDILPFLYAQLGYIIFFNILFCFFFIRKVLKLDKLGDNHDKKIPKKDWIKFSLILVLIVFNIVHIILSYSDQSYWLYGYSNFSLVYFFFIVNYTMQSYIVLKLVTKGNGKRFKPNFGFWLFGIISSIAEIIVVYVSLVLSRKRFLKMLQKL